MVKKIKSGHFSLLFSAYAIVSTISFLNYGVKYVVDSHRYLNYAQNLTEGFYFDPHNFWYFGYVLFIYGVKLLNDDLLTIVIGQYLLGFLAVIALYKTAILLFNNHRSALLSALLYLLFFEITTWNSYILSESFYLSFICFSIYLLAAIYKGVKNPIIYPVTTFVILLTILAKPTGIALLGAVFVPFFYKVIGRIKIKVARWSAVGGICLLFLVLANKMVSTFTIIENDYKKGEIIYAITTLPNHPDLDQLTVEPPTSLHIPSVDNQPLVRITSFILHHPGYWLKLFFLKLYYFIFHIRPYWSIGHNLFSLFFLIPLYLFSIRSLVQNRIPIPIILFILTYLLLHTLSVCLTTVDWDGRFLMPLLPVLFLLGAKGLIDEIFVRARQIRYWKNLGTSAKASSFGSS